jgi:hypothetical protein
MRDDQTPPFSKRFWRIRQYGEKRLDAGGQPISDCYRVSESVGIRWSGTDIPELRNVLIGNAKLLAILNERAEGLSGGCASADDCAEPPAQGYWYRREPASTSGLGKDFRA